MDRQRRALQDWLDGLPGGPFAWLVPLLAMQVLAAGSVPERSWAATAFRLSFYAALGLAMESTRPSRGFFRTAMVVGLLGVGVNALVPTELLVPDLLLAAADLVFIGLVPWIVLRKALRIRPIGPNAILAAIYSYLLLGVVFAYLYAFFGAASPGAFAGDAERGLGAYLYLSLVTLTTLGYGDITPTLPFARNLAALEAVTGQLYLAITVARLVGLYQAQGERGAPRDRAPYAAPGGPS